MSRRLVLTWVLGSWLVAILQASVLTRLPGAAGGPGLVLAAVLAAGYARGAFVGVVLGGISGLILDLVPPAVGPLGGWALVLSLSGALFGHLVEVNRPGPLASLGWMALASAAVVAARGWVLWFAGTAAPLVEVMRSSLVVGLWGLLCAPVALPLARRWLGPSPLRRTRPARQVPADPGLAAGDLAAAERLSR